LGQKRDLAGIETRKGRKGLEKFRADAADPARPGRELTGPWGSCAEAQERRVTALGIKAEAKRRTQRERTDRALGGLERSLLDRRSSR
jgi:hypothetical protein